MIKYIKAHEEHATTPLTISPNHNGWPHQILIDLLDGHKAGELSFCIHKNKGLEFFCDYDAWNKGSDYLIAKIKRDPAFVKEVYEKNLQLGEATKKLVADFVRADITKWSDKQLADFLRDSYKLANDFSAYGYVPVLSDHLFHKFTHLLKAIVKQRVVGKDTGMSIPEMVYILSSHDKQLPSKKARIELLQLVLELPVDEFSESDNKKIEDYYYKWFGVDFGQLGPGKTLTEVLQSAKKLVKDRASVKKELAEVASYPAEIRKKQKELVENLALSEEEEYIFEVAQQFMYLKGLRMELLFSIYACWAEVLTLMSEKYGIAKNLLYYTSIQELAEWLEHNKSLPESLLKDRSEFCVWIAKTATSQEILTGQAAKDFLASLSYKEDKSLEDVLVIHGTVASLGYAKGSVKIVNKTNEISKVKEGDILVSVATHPGLLPAMKKAVAFVTDSGGITSHAAIVAREMKKPCIISTKIATKVLKDGEVIELDTKKGDVFRIRD